MKTVDVTFQNLDSSEISLTDVSHYFDSDPTKLGECPLFKPVSLVVGCRRIQQQLAEPTEGHALQRNDFPRVFSPEEHLRLLLIQPFCRRTPQPTHPCSPTRPPPGALPAVAGLRDDGKMPSAFIADTTTANAQARAGRGAGCVRLLGCFLPLLDAGCRSARSSAACCLDWKSAAVAGRTPPNHYCRNTFSPLSAVRCPVCLPACRCGPWVRPCAWTPAPSCSTPSERLVPLVAVVLSFDLAGAEQLGRLCGQQGACMPAALHTVCCSCCNRAAMALQPAQSHTNPLDALASQPLPPVPFLPQVVRGHAVEWVRGRARDPEAPDQHHGLERDLGHGGQLGVRRGEALKEQLVDV